MLPEPKEICLCVMKHKVDANFNVLFLVTISEHQCMCYMCLLGCVIKIFRLTLGSLCIKPYILLVIHLQNFIHLS